MARRVVLAVGVALVLLSAWPAAAQAPSQFILRAPAAVIGDVVERHGLTVTSVLQDGVEQVVVVTGPVGASPDAVEQDLDDDSAVVACEPDRRVRVPELAAAPMLSQSTAVILEGLGTRTVTSFFGVSAPTTYTAQPASAIIRLPPVRQIATGTGSVVAVIDTGVDATHPMLAGSVVPGYDFTRNIAGVATDVADLSPDAASTLQPSGAGILDQNTVVTVNQSTAVILEQSTAVILEGSPLPAAFGHGTMVAGLIHLVAPGASILPLKAFSADGTANVSDIVRAIYYAVSHGADVINMSFSMTQSSEELMRAIDYATSQNVVCVAAAGNQGRETVVYPAGYRNVIAVASTTNADVRSTFSNFGDASFNVTAPGELVTTTFPGSRYAAASGTSFSAALASGGVALLFQVAPAETVSQAAGDIARGPHIGKGLGEIRLDMLASLQKGQSRNK